MLRQVLRSIDTLVLYRNNWNSNLLKGSALRNVPQNISCSSLSSWSGDFSRKDGARKELLSKESRTKKNTGPKITLVGTDNSISVVGLEEGQKIAKRRNLKLVKMVEYDTKTQRPVYRLMTLAEFNVEYFKEKAEKSSKSQAAKREKILTVTSKIEKHDLESKVKMIEKWLAKDYEIRVVINGNLDDMNVAEGVYKTLEDFLKGKARFLQKRVVHSDIKFQIKSLPVSKSKEEPETNENKHSSSNS